MSEGRLTILVAEDEHELRVYLEMALRCLGYKAELAQDGNEALECLQSNAGEISAVLLDFIMPNRDGIETLIEIRKLYPDLPVIMISGAPSPLNIVTAMKSGATDFLCKPVTHEDLRKALTRALDVKTVECLRPIKSTLPASRVFLGKSARMATIQVILGQVGWSEAPVLIQGETGSGKEMVARELHANSPRAKKAFFKLNCAALPSELVESELFGYERGAFTGAFQRKPGMFEMADGGTILLDEIGDMDVRLQAKLLQVLQDHEFQRIGGKDTIKVDVRVIAATHRDLETAIQHGKFREDLYYRLNVVNLHVPPLRERKEDLVALTEFLMKKHVKAPGSNSADYAGAADRHDELELAGQCSRVGELREEAADLPGPGSGRTRAERTHRAEVGRRGAGARGIVRGSRGGRAADSRAGDEGEAAGRSGRNSGGVERNALEPQTGLGAAENRL